MGGVVGAGEEGAVVPDFLLEGPKIAPTKRWPHPTGEDAVRLCVALGPAMVAALTAAQRTAVREDAGRGAMWRERLNERLTESAPAPQSRE